MIRIGELYPGGPSAQILTQLDELVGCTIEAVEDDFEKVYMRVTHPDLNERPTFVMLMSEDTDETRPGLYDPVNLGEFMRNDVKGSAMPCELVQIGVFTLEQCRPVYEENKKKIEENQERYEHEVYQRLKQKFEPDIEKCVRIKKKFTRTWRTDEAK